jgi:hypothetical protein
LGLASGQVSTFSNASSSKTFAFSTKPTLSSNAYLEKPFSYPKMFPAFNGTIVSLFCAQEADSILSQMNAVHMPVSSVICYLPFYD